MHENNHLRESLKRAWENGGDKFKEFIVKE